MKKGLAVLYDANSFRQFLWYYSTFGEKKIWDVLCLPDGGKGVYIDKYCRRIKIFNKIIVGKQNFINLSLIKKMYLFIIMFFYYIFRKQKHFAKNILNKYVDNINDYDELISNSDIGFISGLLAQFAKEKKVTYLEDGFWDFLPRDKWNCTYKKYSFQYWQGFFISKMGYCANGRFFFEPTKYCNKFCSSIKKMQYLNYFSIEEFSDKNTDMDLYLDCISQAYPEIKEIDFSIIQAVLFTEPFADFSKKPDTYIAKIEKYINLNVENVLIKKHPRDMWDYSFRTDKKIIYLDQSVPAEVILPYIKKKKLFFLCACGIMLNLTDTAYDINVFLFNDLCREPYKDVTRKYYSNIDELRDDLKKVNCNKYNIIDL